MLESIQATLKAKQKIKAFNVNVVDSRKIIYKENFEANELQKGAKNQNLLQMPPK